ncbi:MAG: glycerol-3-phosphate dehydrogenase/oxidase [Chitinophagaceae bacterium]|nr:glycerol-3-phosphate dehydrogenase/oxidase [Chitinophagaceae bacterium]
MIPKTEDGRILFVIPWNDHVLAGTTDTPVERNVAEPVPLAVEINFILGTLKNYFVHSPSKEDILSVFAGLRPLAATKAGKSKTKEISRDHKLFVCHSGLITITGGKWTTYRKMAEEVIDKAIMSGLPCRSGSRLQEKY